MKGSGTRSSLNKLESTRDHIQESARHLRDLSHNLSNALDVLLQASYLLQQSKLNASTRNWVKMIANSAQDAAAHNREIREVLHRLLPSARGEKTQAERPNLQLVKSPNRRARPTSKKSSASAKTTKWLKRPQPSTRLART